MDSSCEVIIVDDGSTDNSNLVYENKRFDSFRVFRTENRGVSHARNLGINEAKGRYLFFLDGDDLISKDLFFDLLSLIKVSDFDFLAWKYTNKLNNLQRLSFKRSLKGHEVLKRFLRRDLSIAMGCFVIRSEILLSNSIRFQESVRYLEDQSFILSCLEFSPKKSFVFSPSTYYRLDNSSAIHKPVNSDRIHGLLEILKKSRHFETFGNSISKNYSAYSLKIIIGVLNEVAKRGVVLSEREVVFSTLKRQIRNASYRRVEVLLNVRFKFLVAFLVASVSPKAYCFMLSRLRRSSFTNDF